VIDRRDFEGEAFLGLDDGRAKRDAGQRSQTIAAEEFLGRERWTASFIDRW